RVLDKAVEEVNTYSDLVIESEFVREGRKVLKLRFKLRERAKKTRLGNRSKKIEGGVSSDQLREKLLITFCLSSEQVEQLFNEYDIQFIKEKIVVIEDSKPFQDGKVQNLPGFLLS